MSDSDLSKIQLRRTLRHRRQSLSVEQQAVAAQAVSRHIAHLPGWRTAQRIALYLAADGEIETTPLSELGRAQRKQLFLPVIQDDDSLCFAAWLPDSPLFANRFGIPEPPAHASRCPAEDLDIIFLPLVGWDLQGGRLGMGGGFYDRTLADIAGPLLVGLAHANQQVDCIPREQWDISLNFIVSDAALHFGKE
ncbi:MAG: 5-formyltetrahydrofolate cyclo-ligase [Gammaproteobacteria bacterium]|nr:MAG: 5-formyltetrahydrofolate cyclo-ligase [Gammaproteobacteria bacterium]